MIKYIIGFVAGLAIGIASLTQAFPTTVPSAPTSTTGWILWSTSTGAYVYTSSSSLPYQSLLTFPLPMASTTDYWTLNGAKLFPTSTNYVVGIGTTTPSATLTVVASTTTSTATAVKITDSEGKNILNVLGDGKVRWGPLNLNVGNTSTLYQWISTTTQNVDPYSFNYVIPSNSPNQKVFSINRISTAGVWLQSPFFLNGYGTVQIGQTNATGQLVVDAGGSFGQIISFTNSHPNGSTLLTVGGAQGGILRLTALSTAEMAYTPTFHINGTKPVLYLNTGGTGAYPFISTAVGGVGTTNPYKPRANYGESNTIIGGSGGQTQSTDALTVENGNIILYNFNTGQGGGGLSSELLTNSSLSVSTSSWSRSGIAVLNHSGAVFTGAGIGSITQTAGAMAGTVKTNTSYQLTYTISGVVGGGCYGIINDPSGSATTTVAASIQSLDTSWRRFGATNYASILQNGTHRMFFRSSEGGLPQSFVLGVYCPAGHSFTMTNISLKEVRGGNIYLGAGGALGIGTSTIGNGIHIVASSSLPSATSTNVFGIYSTSSTSTAMGYIQNGGTAGFYFPYAQYSLTTSTTNASTTGGNVVSFDTEDAEYRITHSTSSNPSRIYIEEAGTYEFIPSVLVMASTPNKHIDVWFQKNGSNVSNSNTHYELPLSGETLITVSSLITSMVAGDYMELAWASTDDASMNLLATPAQSSPSRPLSPAVIMTVKKISN